MEEPFEDLPDDSENLLKRYLLLHIDHYISTTELDNKDKIELGFLKKFFQFSSISKIFEVVEFELDEEDKCIIMNFKQELKLYVDNEYNKYVNNE